MSVDLHVNRVGGKLHAQDHLYDRRTLEVNEVEPRRATGLARHSTRSLRYAEAVWVGHSPAIMWAWASTGGLGAVWLARNWSGPRSSYHVLARTRQGGEADASDARSCGDPSATTPDAGAARSPRAPLIAGPGVPLSAAVYARADPASIDPPVWRCAGFPGALDAAAFLV